MILSIYFNSVLKTFPLLPEKNDKFNSKIQHKLSNKIILMKYLEPNILDFLPASFDLYRVSIRHESRFPSMPVQRITIGESRCLVWCFHIVTASERMEHRGHSQMMSQVFSGF